MAKHRSRSDGEIEAAGGVVWRRRGPKEGRVGVDGIEVLLVHRPRYDDWSLPKGKLDSGEGYEQAAVREVLEETGLRCAMGPELERSRYVDGKGRQKIVRYWMMRPESGTFAPNDEVDAVRWLPVPEARSLLSYARDLPVLESFERLHPAHDA